jgi:hypothetical protein
MRAIRSPSLGLQPRTGQPVVVINEALAEQFFLLSARRPQWFLSSIVLDTVPSYVEVGRREGARLVRGGTRVTGGGRDRGFFVAPTAKSRPLDASATFVAAPTTPTTTAGCSPVAPDNRTVLPSFCRPRVDHVGDTRRVSVDGKASITRYVTLTEPSWIRTRSLSASGVRSLTRSPFTCVPSCSPDPRRLPRRARRRSARGDARGWRNRCGRCSRGRGRRGSYLRRGPTRDPPIRGVDPRGQCPDCRRPARCAPHHETRTRTGRRFGCIGGSWRISQGRPYFRNHVVQARVRDEGARPQTFEDLRLGDSLRPPVEQKLQHLKGLGGKRPDASVPSNHGLQSTVRWPRG